MTARSSCTGSNGHVNALARPATIAALVVIGTAGVVAGRLSAPSAGAAPAASAHAQDTTDGILPGTRPTHSAQPRLPRLSSSATAAAAEGSNEPLYPPRQRAGSVFSSLTDRVRALKTVMPQATAEARVNTLRPYIAGLAEGIRRTNPDLMQVMADEFRRRVCQNRPHDDEAILLAYLASEMPEAASTEAFDCFFADSGQKEDAALWYMLDAWKQSGQLEPPALAQVRARASDPRTLRRLRPPSPEDARLYPGSHRYSQNQTQTGED